MNYTKKYHKYKAKYLDLKNIQSGGKKKTNKYKPVIILFNGFMTPKTLWEYKYVGTSKLQKLDFLSKLKKLEMYIQIDVYTFDPPYFNIFYYYYEKDKQVRKKWNKIYAKYKLHGPNIDFNLEDLDYKNVCKKVYNDVIEKYGKGRKLIPIGHSYGGNLVLLFSKMYKKDCLFSVAIDNAPNTMEFFKKYDNHKFKKRVDKNFKSNDDLCKILNKIKTSVENKIVVRDLNDLIQKVHGLVLYKSSQDRIKYFSNKIHVPTLFFRAYNSNPKVGWNKYAEKEKEQLEKNNPLKMFKYFLMLNTNHFVWQKQEYSDMIIDEINCMIKNS